MLDPAALRSQAAAWYNQARALLDAARAPADDLDLVSLAHASFSSWLLVPGHTATNEAIGSWLVSRAYSAIGEGGLAERWALRCLAAAGGSEVDTFYRSCAREALARAYRVQGRPADVLAETKAARLALAGTAEDDLEELSRDLDDLEARPGSGRLYQVSVHRPKAAFAEAVTGSMHRYGAAARTQAGLVEVRTLRSPDGSTLVGYAVWASREAKAAAQPVLNAAVENDDFAAWEEGTIVGWGLDPA